MKCEPRWPRTLDRPLSPPPERRGDRQRDLRPSAAPRGGPGSPRRLPARWPGLRATPLSRALPSPSERPPAPPSPPGAGALRWLPALSTDRSVSLSVCPGAQPPATGLDGRAEGARVSRGLVSEVGPALCLRRGLPCSVWQRLQILLLRWNHALLLLLLCLYWEYSLPHKAMTVKKLKEKRKKTHKVKEKIADNKSNILKSGK
ncbi:cysteine and tyrosine-rich protein 1 isoform X2 [Hippopotamus amphibius kiboko]|uniref:cysteine and tyrosine-rich protein 1 isoform X2 n=1 Tax=Hippopotamus amphibius kiboko TaxID=575201 RepID=UPI0025913DAA|nr:cysteine and tyrosine-rich protein 1 isoform X2 [Hippopotamus amphibius kiboko]